MIGLRCATEQTPEMGKNFLDLQDKAFWRALHGVISLGISVGLAALILKMKFRLLPLKESLPIMSW